MIRQETKLGANTQLSPEETARGEIAKSNERTQATERWAEGMQNVREYGDRKAPKPGLTEGARLLREVSYSPGLITTVAQPPPNCAVGNERRPTMNRVLLLSVGGSRIGGAGNRRPKSAL